MKNYLYNLTLIELDAGQIVRDEGFSLYESVSALEIMDKKMDSGYLEPGEAMEDEFDFTRELLPEEVIGIIDQLLCLEMAWHMGYPLAQTIFTSLHVDRVLWPYPRSINETFFDRNASNEFLMNQVLRAYCLGLIKTCYYINNLICAEYFYEEEDFVTHTFNRRLLDNIELNSILELLCDTITVIKSSGYDENYKSALKVRLDFRVEFLKAVENDETRTLATKSVWSDLDVMIPELRTSTTFGTLVPFAFSEKLQNKLASTVPPRTTIQVFFEDALNHFKRLCLDASVLSGILNYSDCHSFLTFIMIFQARKPQPSVYVRALLQQYIFAGFISSNNFSMRQVIDENLATMILPAHLLLDPANDEVEMPSDTRYKIAAQMKIFRSRAVGSYFGMIKVFCQNRCRIRRTLCHTLVDWNNFQLDAEEIDRRLHEISGKEAITDPVTSPNLIWSFPLSSWAYYYKVYQMELIVQLGFELELYHPIELAGMYWYLQYFTKNRSHHIERMKDCVIQSYHSAQKTHTITPENHEKFSEALQFIAFTKLRLAATCSFADGLSCLFVVLNRLSLIKSPYQPYNNDDMRYEARMKPFVSISVPEIVSFDKFKRLVTKPDRSILELLHFAAKSIAGARKNFEAMSKLTPKESLCLGSEEYWLKDVKDTIKACISTSITIANVIKTIGNLKTSNECKLKVEIPKPETCYHCWWIVPSVLPNV